MPIFDASLADSQVKLPLDVEHAGDVLGVLRVSVTVGSIRDARTFVRATLGEPAVVACVIDDAVLLVSELVTNVVRHCDGVAEPQATVRLIVIGKQLRIEVHDASPLLPTQRAASEDAEHGRGLMVVGALSERWGYEPTPDGKCVWCELTARPERRRPSMRDVMYRDDGKARRARVSGRATAWGAYKSITDVLRRRVVAGEFAAGSMLPSEAALTKEFSVSRNTLRRALTDLEQEGLIKALPGRGRIVTSPDELGDESPDPHLQYRRIAAELREKIEHGELQAGELLPSEAALTAQYGVSRWTARQALVELQGAGLVDVVHGKGRFVREPPVRDV